MIANKDLDLTFQFCLSLFVGVVPLCFGFWSHFTGFFATGAFFITYLGSKLSCHGRYCHCYKS